MARAGQARSTWVRPSPGALNWESWHKGWESAGGPFGQGGGAANCHHRGALRGDGQGGAGEKSKPGQKKQDFCKASQSVPLLTAADHSYVAPVGHSLGLSARKAIKCIAQITGDLGRQRPSGPYWGGEYRFGDPAPCFPGPRSAPGRKTGAQNDESDLLARAGYESGHYVRGVAVQRNSDTVIAHRRARVSVVVALLAHRGEARLRPRRQ